MKKRLIRTMVLSFLLMPSHTAVIAASPPLATIRTGHTGAIASMTLHQEGSLLYSAGEDGKLMVWDVQTGRLLQSIRADRLPIRAIAAFPGGEHVALYAGDGRREHRISVWNWTTGELEYAHVPEDEVLWMEVSPYASYLVYSVPRLRSIQILDALSGRQLPFLRQTTGIVNWLLTATGEERLLTYSASTGLITYRNIVTGSVAAEFEAPEGLKRLTLLEQRRFAAATVVVIHDMVPLRAAGLVKPHDLESFRRRSQAITEEATLVGCMSRVIRDADVVGLLGCPAEKTRIVLPAVPADLVESHAEPTATARHAAAGKPYLFYPSAFRPYKNHALLIETAAALAGTPAAVDLVFTGDGRLPDDLARLAKRLGVAGRVHVLGRVPRGELASLYRNATATIVPSRYEQGSFPLLEAMQWGSPVAASDIPALREAFAPLGGAIPFFNPDDACGLARIVAEIAAEREAVRAAQRPGFEMLCRRNWQQVADEWIDVFVEAIRLHAATAPSAAAGMP